MTLTLTPKRVFVTEAVKLAGYQACLKPSKFGYSLSALLPDSAGPLLEDDREEALKWCLSKLSNPKRSVQKPEPWIEDDENPGYYRVKFSWSEDNKPYIVDSEGTAITDDGIPLFSDSVVKLAFKQKPYVLKDGVTYGTSLKLVGVQILSLNKAGVGTDSGDLSDDEIADLFRSDQAHGLDAAEAKVARTVEISDDDEF